MMTGKDYHGTSLSTARALVCSNCAPGNILDDSTAKVPHRYDAERIIATPHLGAISAQRRSGDGERRERICILILPQRPGSQLGLQAGERLTWSRRSKVEGKVVMAVDRASHFWLDRLLIPDCAVHVPCCLRTTWSKSILTI